MKVFELTMLLIGAIIGAGFATGAELVTFFGNVNLPVWLLLLLIGIAHLVVMAGLIRLQAKTPPSPYGKWLEAILIIIYLMLFTAMTAGIRAIGGSGTCILSLIFCGLIVQFGFEGMTRVNTMIVMTIVIILLGICLPHLVFPKIITPDFGMLPVGIGNAFLYAGLNCLMLPELFTAATKKHTHRDLFIAAIITAVIISCFAGLIINAIRTSGTAQEVMPLLATSKHPVTFVIILLAILTSQYTALFAINAKTQKICGRKNNTIIYGYAAAGFLGSQWGFNQILNFCYPLIGAFTCGFLIFSWGYQWHQRRVRR